MSDPFADLATRLEADEQAASAALGSVPAYPMDALPAAARDLVDSGGRNGLPPALVAGAALAALAGAIGANSQLEVIPSWHQRPILWIPLLAPRGAGKSPAQDLAFGPIRDYDAQLDDDGDDDARPAVRLGDQTLEALARNLRAGNGAGLIDVDELATLLRGLGEYKRGGGGDRGRFLALWSGAPWSFDRVGGGAKTNKVKLRIPRPTLVVCGGLQPALHELLGGEEDGLRPRWLPHLAGMADVGSLTKDARPIKWQQLLGGELLAAREAEREWKLSEQSLAAFEHFRRAWKLLARKHELASTAAALWKADIHLARVALVLAEAEEPAAGGAVGVDVVERAAMIVDFTLNCWRALPEQGTLALTKRDWLLDRAIVRLVAYLEEHDGGATRRELQRACVAGCRTADDLDALLARYEETFPGTVTEAGQEQGGLPTKIVRAPLRRPVLTVSAFADNVERARQNPLEKAVSGAVGHADTAAADTAAADTERSPHAGGERLPVPGDEGFLDQLRAAYRHGSLTRDEWLGMVRRHASAREYQLAKGAA